MASARDVLVRRVLGSAPRDQLWIFLNPLAGPWIGWDREFIPITGTETITWQMETPGHVGIGDVGLTKRVRRNKLLPSVCCVGAFSLAYPPGHHVGRRGSCDARVLHGRLYSRVLMVLAINVILIPDA